MKLLRCAESFYTEASQLQEIRELSLYRKYNRCADGVIKVILFFLLQEIPASCDNECSSTITDTYITSFTSTTSTTTTAATATDTTIDATAATT